MRQLLSFFLATLLHAGLAAATLIYLPAASRDLEELAYVPVELVMLADNTNVRAAREEPEPEREEIQPIETEPEPEPEPVNETLPETLPPEPEVVPEPVIEPEPEPEPVLPEPEVEPEPEPEPQEPALNLNDLSRLLDVSRDQTNADTDDNSTDRRAVGAGTAMTATLQNMAASQIQRCLRSNADAPSNMDLRVRVSVRLERDGNLSDPPQLVDARRVMTSTNPYLRTAGERALRAVIECAPYNLPAANYSEWRLLDVNVNTQFGRR